LVVLLGIVGWREEVVVVVEVDSGVVEGTVMMLLEDVGRVGTGVVVVEVDGVVGIVVVLVVIVVVVIVVVVVVVLVLVEVVIVLVLEVWTGVGEVIW